MAVVGLDYSLAIAVRDCLVDRFTQPTLDACLLECLRVIDCFHEVDELSDPSPTLRCILGCTRAIVSHCVFTECTVVLVTDFYPVLRIVDELLVGAGSHKRLPLGSLVDSPHSNTKAEAWRGD
jgi:hypothetical protein